MEFILDDSGLSDRQMDLAQKQRDLAGRTDSAMTFSPRTMPTSQFVRGLERVTGQMGVWREENLKQSKILRSIHTSIVTYEIVTGGMMAAIAAAKLARSKELAQAVALTAANIWNPATAWKIPLALGAALAVYGAFKTGEEFGLREVARKQSISDRSNMSEVRTAAAQARDDMGRDARYDR